MKTIIVKVSGVCLMQDPEDLTIVLSVSEKAFGKNPDATFRVPNSIAWQERVLNGRLIQVMQANKDHTDLVPGEPVVEKEPEKVVVPKKVAPAKGKGDKSESK